MTPRGSSRRWAAAVAVASALAGCGGDDRGPPPAADVDAALAALGRLLAATPPAGRTPGSNEAIAQLVRDQFIEAGVADVTIEPFSIPVSASANHHLAVTGAGALDHEVNVFGGDGAVVAAPVIDLGLAKAVQPEAAGKIALLDFSLTRSLRTQYRNIVASGAVGAIIDAKLDVLRQRNVWQLASADQIEGPIPIVTVAQADAAAIRAQLAAGTDVQVDLATDAAVAPRTAYNVIARIPGTTQPERTLVINGHLDSWFTGAADDAQAIAALVGLARTFHDQPLPFTLELVAFDCEETFSLGSNNYLMRRMPAARDSLVGAISLEMLAPKHRELSIVTLDDKATWLPPARAGGLTDVFDITFTPSDLMTAFDGEVPSDQGNFWQLGIPGLLVVTSYDEYHSSLDGPDNTDVERYGQVLTALAQTVRELGKVGAEALSVRPTSSIRLEPAITSQTAQGVAGTIAASNARSAQPVDNAVVTVTVYNESYDAILASAAATFVAGAGYTFAIDHAFVAGTSYVLSFDAVIPGQAAGRAVLRF